MSDETVLTPQIKGIPVPATKELTEFYAKHPDIPQSEVVAVIESMFDLFSDYFPG